MPPSLSPTTSKQRLMRRLGVLALLVGLVLLGLFSVRTWRQVEYNQRVASGQIQVETLRGWMTLPYIARVYGVPEARLRETLELPATGDEQRSLRNWFEVTGLDPAAGRRRVEALIIAEAARREGKEK